MCSLKQPIDGYIAAALLHGGDVQHYCDVVEQRSADIATQTIGGTELIQLLLSAASAAGNDACPAQLSASLSAAVSSSQKFCGSMKIAHDICRKSVASHRNAMTQAVCLTTEACVAAQGCSALSFDTPPLFSRLVHLLSTQLHLLPKHECLLYRTWRLHSFNHKGEAMLLAAELSALQKLWCTIFNLCKVSQGVLACASADEPRLAALAASPVQARG